MTEQYLTATVPAQQNGSGQSAVTVLPPSASLMPSSGEWDTMWSMAEAFSQSGLLPPDVKTPAAALMLIQKGRELNIPPACACSNIHVIKGKPSCSAELMLALIKSRVGPDAMIVEETDDKKCTVSYARPGWTARRCLTYTIEQAERAGLYSKADKTSNWAKHTEAMLRARCISAAARLEFPDVIGGMYTPEELGARVVVDLDGSIIYDATPERAPLSRPSSAALPAPEAQPVTQGTMKHLYGNAKAAGISPDDVHTLVAWEFGLKSRNDLMEDQAGWLADGVKDRGNLVLAIVAEARKRGLSREQVYKTARQPCLAYLDLVMLGKLAEHLAGLPVPDGAPDETAPAAAPAAAPAPDKPASVPAVRAQMLGKLRATQAALGLPESELVNLCGERYGAESIDELKDSQVADLESHVRGNYDPKTMDNE